MKQLGDFARITSALVLMVSGWIAGFAVPVHCQEAQRFEPRAKAQLTAASWVPTGNLITARSGHTATLLPNGKVLIVGGIFNNSAELYDPATGTWNLTGRPNAGRVAHTATLLPNGQILVVGGQDSTSFGFLQSAELYDPSTGTWRLTGSLTSGRSEHTATLLQTGKVLVAGGEGTSGLAQTELYDPAAGTWSDTGSLITPRVLHQATLLQDGRVLVTGGTTDDDNFPPLNSWELYDPGTGTWRNTAAFNTPRTLHTATLLRNGMVLVAGGEPRTAELFDPATGQSSGTGSLNAGRVYHTATLLADGSVLVAGGQSPVSLDSSELYDQSTGKWVYTSNLNAARFLHTATLLPNGQVLVAGGSNAGGRLNSAELYGLAAPPGTIGPGFTGAWYDPAQSGHGLFVEVLTENRFYAAWFAFNPAGSQQAWFTGVGTYSGNTATIAAVEQPTGGRWIPNFDPNQIVRNAWGTLTFTVTDCNHGTVDFNSVLGYGAGSMNLTRLTQPAGLTCP